MRKLLPAVIATVAVGALAAPALAHVDLERTSPGRGKTAKTSLRTVTVSFSGSFVTGKITVVGPRREDRRPRRPGPAEDLAAARRAEPGLKPGTYRTTWRILDEDGHRQNGSFTFRLRK